VPHQIGSGNTGILANWESAESFLH